VDGQTLLRQTIRGIFSNYDLGKDALRVANLRRYSMAETLFG
jgi:hypothetical protein